MTIDYRNPQTPKRPDRATKHDAKLLSRFLWVAFAALIGFILAMLIWR